MPIARQTHLLRHLAQPLINMRRQMTPPQQASKNALLGLMGLSIFYRAPGIRCLVVSTPDSSLSCNRASCPKNARAAFRLPSHKGGGQSQSNRIGNDTQCKKAFTKCDDRLVISKLSQGLQRLSSDQHSENRKRY